MSEQKSNAFVSLIKKSVGIKDNASGCCGPTSLAGASEAACCGTEAEAKAEAKPAAKASSTGCCGSESTSSGSCC